MVQHNLSASAFASATVSVAVAVCLPFCLCGKGDGTGVHNAGWGSPPPPPEPRQGKKEEEETGPFIYTQSRSTQTTPSLTLENYPVDGPPSTPSRRPRLCADSAHAGTPRALRHAAKCSEPGASPRLFCRLSVGGKGGGETRSAERCRRHNRLQERPLFTPPPPRSPLILLGATRHRRTATVLAGCNSHH